MSKRPQGALWVVSGSPGAGKTMVGRLLAEQLDQAPALIDKDTVFTPLINSMLRSHGRPVSEREGEWHDSNIKTYEYQALFELVVEVRSFGCDVVLSAPMTSNVRDDEAWGLTRKQLGQGSIELVWVGSDKETIRQRLTERGHERDASKMHPQAFDAFIERVQPEKAPAVQHWAIDNRLGALSLEMQVQNLIKLTTRNN